MEAQIIISIALSSIAISFSLYAIIKSLNNKSTESISETDKPTLPEPPEFEIVQDENRYLFNIKLRGKTVCQIRERGQFNWVLFQPRCAYPYLLDAHKQELILQKINQLNASDHTRENGDHKIRYGLMNAEKSNQDQATVMTSTHGRKW